MLGQNVVTSLLARWLYDKLVGKALYVRFAGESYAITLADLGKLIERVRRRN